MLAQKHFSNNDVLSPLGFHFGPSAVPGTPASKNGKPKDAEAKGIGFRV